MMLLSQLVLVKKSSKHLSRRKVKILSGSNNANCKFKYYLVLSMLTAKDTKQSNNDMSIIYQHHDFNKYVICPRQIPQYGNRSEVTLKVLHRSYLGGDEFLGHVSLPLQDFDVYEKPKAK